MDLVGRRGRCCCRLGVTFMVMEKIWTFLAELGVFVVLPYLVIRAVRAGDAKEASRIQAFRDLAEDQGWKYLDGRYDFAPKDLANSVLAAFKGLHEDFRLLGAKSGRLFVWSEISIDRPTHFLSEKLTLVEFELPRVSPHVLIVPRGLNLIGAVSLENDYRLRAMELEGRPVKLYVPEGFEIEALQVLEPDAWGAMVRGHVALEFLGPTLRFIWTRRLEPSEAMQALEDMSALMKRLYGVAETEIQGPRAAKMKVNPVVRWVSNLSMEQVLYIFLGVFMAGVIVLQFSHDW